MGPTGNSVVLIRENDTGSLRHGGWRTYRHFKLYINGKLCETISDDCPTTAYYTGKHLDEIIDNHLKLLGDLLNCTPVRGKIKGFVEGAGDDRVGALRRRAVSA